MDILQKAFSADLIALVSSDEEFEKIEASVAAVAKLLASRPTEYVGAVYVAAGGGTQSTPLLEDVFSLVKKEWRTVVMRYPGFPANMLRAILLCSVVKLAEQQPEFAEALGLLLPNVTRQLSGSDQVVALWQEIADTFQRRYEDQAEASWSVPSSIDLPQLRLSKEAGREFSASRKSLDAEKLATLLLPAFTNSNSAGEALDKGNPQSFQQLPAWGRHAAERIASVISGPVANTLKVEVEGPDTAALGAELTTYTEEAVSRLLSAVEGQDMRTRLLWWKESGYSPSARAPYRDLEPSDAVVHAVVDLSSWLPDKVPPSAFHFVGIGLPMDGEVGISAKEIVSRPSAKVLGATRTAISGEWEPATLIEVLDPAAGGKVDDIPLESLPTTPASMVDHLLREILAVRMLKAVKPGKKPRT